MNDPFAACWHRIERAEVHQAAAAEVWDSWLEEEPYYPSVEHQGDGVFALCIIQALPAPPELAMLMGEWLYNLRCALDYAVYAGAKCVSGQDPPPGEGSLQFPCSLTESEYRDNVRRQLGPLAGRPSADVIESMQPFRREDKDNSALWWLHELARIDRHRRLHFMGGYTAEVEPLVMVPTGCTLSDLSTSKAVIDEE